MLSGRRGEKPAAAGCFSLETDKKQILRADYSKVFKSRSALRSALHRTVRGSAQDDMVGAFFSSLLD